MKIYTLITLLVLFICIYTSDDHNEVRVSTDGIGSGDFEFVAVRPYKLCP